MGGLRDPEPEAGALPEHIPHGLSLLLLLLTRRTCLARSCRQAVRSVRFDFAPRVSHIQCSTFNIPSAFSSPVGSYTLSNTTRHGAGFAACGTLRGVGVGGVTC